MYESQEFGCSHTGNHRWLDADLVIFDPADQHILSVHAPHDVTIPDTKDVGYW